MRRRELKIGSILPKLKTSQRSCNNTCYAGVDASAVMESSKAILSMERVNLSSKQTGATGGHVTSSYLKVHGT